MNNYLTIRNARLIFRNFSGKGSQYNPEGRRNFDVVIDDSDLAQALINDGWNLKPLKATDGDESVRYHLPVAVFYGKYPPKIGIKTNTSTTIIPESEVSMLDWADIITADLTIRPRKYEDVAGRSGIKAYLKTLIVTIQEDELEKEYLANLSDGDDIPF